MEKAMKPGRSGPAAQATIGNDLAAIFSKISAMQHDIAKLTVEVRCLQRERRPASSEIIGELCGTIYGVCGVRPFTAAEIFDWAMENVDENAARLSNAMIRFTGPDPEVRTVARLLTRARGTYGPWRLRIHKQRSNIGREFKVTK